VGRLQQTHPASCDLCYLRQYWYIENHKQIVFKLQSEVQMICMHQWVLSKIEMVEV
jgi:hypothetical protein